MMFATSSLSVETISTLDIKAQREGCWGEKESQSKPRNEDKETAIDPKRKEGRESSILKACKQMDTFTLPHLGPA